MKEIERKVAKMQGFQSNDTKPGDKYGLYHRMMEVQSELKHRITSDFVLGKLEEHQKDAVIELVRDAYAFENLIQKLKKYTYFKVDKNGKFIQNNDGTYKRYHLNEDNLIYIENCAKYAFNTIMIKLIMTVIMYRNIDNNVLVELMAEKDKLQSEQDQLREETKTIGGKLKNKLKNEEDK